MRVLHIGRGFRPFLINGLLGYAEDLMDIQVAHGYKVAYFFSGRHYPLLRRPWLRKWLRKDIRMYEIINSPICRGFEQGTMYPELDLNEEYSEKFLEKTLSEFKPDIVHIQDLFGLPSSLIDIVKLKDIPVLMTLHDYFPLCPTSKLFDYKHSICSSQYVGDKCVSCCAQAPGNSSYMIDFTLQFEKKRWLPKTLRNKLKAIKYLLKPFIKSLLKPFFSSLRNKNAVQNIDYSFKKINFLEEVFQERRYVNIERLNKLDLLVSQSFKTAEIYQELGIQAKRIKTIHSTPKHIDYVKPKKMEEVILPINFVTLNGCASVQKGVYLILNALRELKKLGLTSHFRLFVMGSVLGSVKDELLQFDNVVYHGPYNVTDLDSLLEEMHVGLVPSVWEEVYGYVGIEFLAKGIPVIGNNLGGIVDYTVDNVTGRLNKDNTAEGLAQIMAAIIQNPGQILDLNRSIISGYHQVIKSMDGHFDEINKIYKDLSLANQKQEV